MVAGGLSPLRYGIQDSALERRDPAGKHPVEQVIRVRQSYSRGEFGAPKSRRSSRAVPLADSLAAELDRHYQQSGFRDDDDLVFCHPQIGGPYDASKLHQRFKKAAREAGLRDVRFHDLRHTFGTRMAAVGTPMRSIQEYMGHRDLRTTQIYADYAPDPTRGASWAETAFAPTTDLAGTLLGKASAAMGRQHPSLRDANARTRGFLASLSYLSH